MNVRPGYRACTNVRRQATVRDREWLPRFAAELPSFTARLPRFPAPVTPGEPVARRQRYAR